MVVLPLDRIRAYRTRQRELGCPDSSRRYAKEQRRDAKKEFAGTERPFTGCDGEGSGTDDTGRQLYKLFRMGERELYDQGSRLETWDLLDFICNHPPGEILVGFAFGYDITMILRDLPEKQQRRLFEPKTFAEGHSPFVWYKDFDIDYLPKQYLKVRRVKVERYNDGSEKRIAVKGSTRTIYETFGFFQKSFVKVITEFSVGSEAERKRIDFNKSMRESFTEITQEVRNYCGLECRLLAELMEQLRGYCHAAGIVPRSWNGAGKLAASLLALHDTPKAKRLGETVPPGVFDYSNMAYYGGRFEIDRTGLIGQKVYENDIRSAYPDNMRKLPCLIHGRWQEADAKACRTYSGLFVSGAKFNTPQGPQNGRGQLGGLPIRSQEGHLYWPLQGSGVYWNVELEAAKLLGVKIRLSGGWTYHRQCDCKPFDWIEPLFEYRRSIGSSGPGYPIKLGINSLYGKQAQRKGNGVYNNMIWASLTTALTRAKIMEAASQSPKDIVMIATDALYSLKPLDLDIGERLGQWETTELNSLFIVQPGLYWSPDLKKKKSRGLSGKFFEDVALLNRFEREWRRYHEFENSKLEAEFPSVEVPVPGFIGLKLALSRNKPELAGTWVKDKRLISFDYRNKRQGHSWRGDHIVTGIKAGFPGLQSLPHRDFLKAGGQEPWEAARLMLEEQPDYVDLGIPFKD